MSEMHTPLIPCRDAVRQLWDYLYDALEPDGRRRIDEHLAFCRRCCGELEFIGHLRNMLASPPTEELPPQAVERLERFVEEL